jgi:hypothetical protein
VSSHHRPSDLAQEHLFLGEGSDREVAHRLGNRLREFIDRPLGGLVLRRSEGTTGGARRWHIERV